MSAQFMLSRSELSDRHTKRHQSRIEKQNARFRAVQRSWRSQISRLALSNVSSSAIKADTSGLKPEAVDAAGYSTIQATTNGVH